METTNLIQTIREKVSTDVLGYHSYLGDDTVVIRKESLLTIMKMLKEQFQLSTLTDLTAVDFLAQHPRFEVVYHLHSIEKNVRLRVKVPVADGEEVDSLTPLWPIANWLEREVWDMFGSVSPIILICAAF